MSLPPILKTKAKAFGAALLTALAVYGYSCYASGSTITLHGLEGAAIGAVVAFFGVHQIANAAPKVYTSARPPRKEAVPGLIRINHDPKPPAKRAAKKVAAKRVKP